MRLTTREYGSSGVLSCLFSKYLPESDSPSVLLLVGVVPGAFLLVPLEGLTGVRWGYRIDQECVVRPLNSTAKLVSQTPVTNRGWLAGLTP